VRSKSQKDHLVKLSCGGLRYPTETSGALNATLPLTPLGAVLAAIANIKTNLEKNVPACFDAMPVTKTKVT
jgi:hypothetical protein